jgi:hypothetical protein
VDDGKDYAIPFRFTGRLDRLTLKIEPPKLSPEDVKKLEAAMRNSKMNE